MPPVTAERSPPDSRITGADSPVIADSSTEPTPSMISPSAGMTSPASTTTTSPRWSSGAGTSSSAPLVEPAARGRRRARRAQRVRLRLAAPLGDRLGEVREQHGQPEPERRSRRRTRGCRVPADEVEEEDPGRDHAAELDDEHHRVLEPGGAGRASGTSRGRRRAAISREKMLADCACHYRACSLSSARLSSSTLTPGSPKKPRLRPSVFCLDQLLDASRAAGCARLRCGATAAARRPARCAGRCPSRRS